AFGVAHLAPEYARVRKLHRVRRAVARAQRRQAEAAQRGQAPAEEILPLPVHADHGPCLGPGTVEKRQHAVMEHVEEAQEPPVAMVACPVARPVGEVDRQRAVGPEHPEHPLHQARGAPLACRLESRHRRGRERERGFLPEAHRLVERAPRLADARVLRMRGLDEAHRLEEIELPGRLRELPSKLGLTLFTSLYRTGRCPNLVGHRITSPRPITSRAVSVNELREACRAKNSSSTEPSRNAPVPSNARSSQERRTPMPRPKVTGPRPGMRRVIGSTRTERIPSRWRRTTDSASLV